MFKSVVGLICFLSSFVLFSRGQAMPLVKVSSIYWDQTTGAQTPLSGYGVLLQTRDDSGGPRYWVLTVSHLSQGNVPNSLELEMTESDGNPSGLKLEAMERRHVNVLRDLELIEVKQPQRWVKGSQAVGAEDSQGFWGYQVAEAGGLSPRSIVFCQKIASEAASQSLDFVMIDSVKFEIPFTEASRTSGIPVNSVPDPLGLYSLATGFSNKFAEGVLLNAHRVNTSVVTGDLIVYNFSRKGMSGLPLVFTREIGGQTHYCLGGLVRAVHRVLKKTYVIHPLSVSAFIVASIVADSQESTPYPRWVMQNGVTYRVHDENHTLRESYFPEVLSAGNQETSDSGGHDTSDGGGSAAVSRGSALSESSPNLPEPGAFDEGPVLAYQVENETYYAHVMLKYFMDEAGAGSVVKKWTKQDLLKSFKSILGKRIAKSQASRNSEGDFFKNLWRDQLLFIEKMGSLSLLYKDFKPSYSFDPASLKREASQAKKTSQVWPLCEVQVNASEPTFELNLTLPVGPEKQFRSVPLTVRVEPFKGSNLFQSGNRSNRGKNGESGNASLSSLVQIEPLPLFGFFRLHFEDPTRGSQRLILDLTGLFYFNVDYAFENPIVTPELLPSQFARTISEIAPRNRVVDSVDQLMEGLTFFMKTDSEVKRLSGFSEMKKRTDSNRFTDPRVPYYSALLNYYNKRAFVIIADESTGYEWPLTCF